MTNAFEIYRSVFSSNDPFDNPFRKFERFTILYPTDGYHLSRRQFSALQRVSGQGFFALNCEYDELETSSDSLWLPEGLGYAEYLAQPLYLENCLFSPDGGWGTIVSHEDHALLGGSTQFLSSFADAYPDVNADRNRFAEQWSGVSWAEKLLEQATG